MSINKEVGNVVRSNNLQIASFDGIAARIDDYNAKMRGSVEAQEAFRKTAPIDTFQAYAQTLGDNKATLEGYQQYLGQTAHGFKGVATAMDNFNSMSLQGIEQQNAYATAIGISNKNLGNYLTNLNGAKASMGGYVSWLVKTKAATIGLKAASIALNVVLLMVSTVIVKRVTKVLDDLIHSEEKACKKAEEVAQETGKAFDKLKSDMQELDKLIKEYNNLQISNEWDNTPIETKKKLQEDINRLLSDEADRLDIINGKYKEVTEELFKHRINGLEREEKSAFDNERAKKDSLWKETQVKGLEDERHFIINVSDMNDKESELFARYSDAFSPIRKGYTGNGQYGAGSYDDTIISYDWSGYYSNSVDDFLERYDKANKLLLELREGMRYGEISENSKLYNRLDTFVRHFDNKVQEYRTSLDESKKVNASLKLSNYITDNLGGYIDNLDEYSAAIKWINETFSEEDKDNAIGFLSSYFSEYSEKIDTATGDICFSLETLKTGLDKIQSAYQAVQSAIEEYNEEGYLSVDTFQSLMELEPKYLNMLIDESGNINLNTDAINKNTAAYIENLGIKSALNLIDSMSKYTGEAEQLEYLTGSTNELTNATWDLVNAKLKEMALVSSPVVMDALANRINAIQQMTEAAKEGIGKGSLGKKSSDKSDKSAEKEKERALKALQYRFDLLELSIEKVNTALSLLENTLDLQSEDDYVGKLETVTRQLELAQKKSALLRDEFTQLSNTEYSTADEANELATRMKSVADSIADNTKNIIGYGRSITEYYMSALSAIGSLSSETVERATSLFERNVKTLSEGGLTGLQFTLSPIVPQSALEKQRQENRAIEEEMRLYHDTLAAMQKEAFDLQYKESQEHSEDTQKLQQTTSNNTLAIQKTTNDKTSAAQKTDDNNKLKEEKIFISSFKNNITELNNWIVDNLIKAPALDNSWEKLVDNAKEYAKQVQDAFSGNKETIGKPGNTGYAVVDTAMKYIGTPYKWGGKTPSGFDCSGLVSYVLKEVGKLGAPFIGNTSSLYKQGTSVDKADLQPDDIVFFVGSDGTKSSPGHVGIYIGDGKYIHAPKTGDVVKISNLADRKDYVGARRYAEGTSGAVGGKSLVGEEGKELGILPNGKVIELGKHGAELVDIPKGTQIFNHEQTEEIEKYTGSLDGKSIPKYATGTLSSYSNLGNLDVVTQLPKLSVEQIEKLIEKYFSRSGSVVRLSDAEGIYKAQMDSGISALAVLAIGALESAYGTSKIAKAKGNLWGYGAVDNNPMGGAYTFGSNVGEAAQQYSAELLKDFYNGWGEKTIAEMGNNYATNKNWASSVTGIMNKFKDTLTKSDLDSVSDSAQYLSDISSNVAAIRKSFDSQLQEWLNGGIDTSTANGIEDDLLSYIKENIDRSAYANEEFVQKWNEFQAINDESTKVFKELDKHLLESVGTSDYNAVKNEVLKTASEYTNTMMKASAETTLAELKNQYNLNKAVADKMLAFYNLKKVEGANADELKIIIDKYNEQLEKVQDISDNWVSQMQSLTEYLASENANKVTVHDNALSWMEKDLENLRRERDSLDESDYTGRANNASQQLDMYSKINAELEAKQASAHQNVLDLYKNDKYKSIAEKWDIESWFDAEGEAAAEFANVLKYYNSLGDSEGAALSKQLFDLIQPNKKAWYEVEDAKRDIADARKDLISEMKLEKVELWEQYQNRLVETLDYQKNLNDAIATAKQSMYDFYDSLREEENSINTELQKSMQLAEWLDEDTRKLLFNLEDYSKETKVINDLYAKAKRLYADYQNDINALTEEEAWKQEGITAEYNKQIAALQDKLSIAKQELDVAKKQAALNNALKERDTQVIMGNGVRNIADPERLSQLAEEKAQSELELDNLNIKSTENADIRGMERISDKFADSMSEINSRLEMLNSMPEATREKFADFLPPLEEIEAKLAILAKADPWYMINENSSDAILKNLPWETLLGFDLSYDYQAGIEKILRGYSNGTIEQSDALDLVVEQLKRNHDNKTQTDAHNAGYAKYGVGEYEELGRYLLKMYVPSSDMEFFKSQQSDVATQNALTDESDTIKIGDISITGKGSISAMLNPSDFRPFSIEELAERLGAGKISMTAIHNMFSGLMNIDNLYTDLVRKPVSAVTDNSIHIDNVNITKPVATADDIISSLVQKSTSIAAVTNNQR